MIEKPFQPKAVLISCSMWNKVSRLKYLSFLLALLTDTVSEIKAQKKWDGGGGDSLWNNPLNWQPDGIPTATDTVILNNQWITANYHVYFPEGMITSHAFSLSIEPSIDYNINITLPNTNTGAPGLNLYSGDIALSLYDRSVFINASGASAGNAIQLSGKIIIKNGGKYIHQTQRGNALLISNLLVNTETQWGVFELNVPGNSAYTLSASGRTFGSLVFKGQNSTRKTYASSGNNPLTIKGDLIINDQASFNSSLTNNISVSGNMVIKGRLYINPITSDSIGRCIETNGSNNSIEISGQFNQGIHFRKWLIAGNYKLQNSTINIDQSYGKIHVQSGTTIDLGNAIIKGAGEFVTDSNTSFLSSATSIIGTDTGSNIQTQFLNLHPVINFSCYGSFTQSTGDRFPDSISKLKLDKINNNVHLTKSLTIADSLLLFNGKILTTDTSSITISRYCNWGNDKSYFTGKMIHKSEATTLFFPLGNDSLYTPIQIIRKSGAGRIYELITDSLSSSLFSHPTIHPIQQLSNRVSWTIKSHQQWEVDEEAQLILKTKQNTHTNCLAILEPFSQQWRLASLPVSNDSILVVNLDPTPSKILTVGKLFPHVLPLSTISLHKKIKNQEYILTWKVDEDENAAYYILEQSTDGIKFHANDTIKSIRHRGSFTYSKAIKRFNTNIYFYRIIGVDLDGRLFKSNILAENKHLSSTLLFPNPTHDILYFRYSDQITKISIINPSGEIKSAQYELKRKLVTISVKELKPGSYFLVIEQPNRKSTIQFIKL